MLMNHRFLAAILLVAVSLATAEPPRYRFEVGQKITYEGKAESRYKDDKHDYNTDEAVRS
jgi:hypothetical protein